MDFTKLSVTKPVFKKGTIFGASKLTLDGGPLKLKLTGNLFMPPRMQESLDYGVKYSMGVEFEQESLKVLDETLLLLAKELGSGYECKPSHNDGSVFINLPVKEEKFSFKSNISLKTDNLPNDKIEAKSNVTVEVEVGVWILNSKTAKKFGVSLKPFNIIFERVPGKKRRAKSVMSSEDDIDLTVISDDGQESPCKRKKALLSSTDRQILKGLASK
jgi:hypothetical protein